METDFLNLILEKKDEEIKHLRAEPGLASLKKRAETHRSAQPFSFSNTLSKNGLHLIAEIKKASPSKGIIRPDFEPLKLADEFIKSGASALSVLTETHYFLGNPEFITQIKSRHSTPVLRKDFILDPIQVYESRCLGADAILLIKAMLTVSRLNDLLDLATELKMDGLCEIHSPEEWEEIKHLPGLKLVGINNRDLKTFRTDSSLASRLIRTIRQDRPDLLVIAESSYDTVSQMTRLEQEGFNAVLIGEGLARNPDLVTYFKRTPSF